jgi:RimK family alpha-L-glutamate ligase
MAQRSGRVVVVGFPQAANVLLAEAWPARGIDAELLPPKRALEVLQPGDVAVVRLDVLRTLDGVEPGFDVVKELERRGVRVVNRPAALLSAHDKLRTATLLAAAELPHPRTVHIGSANDPLALAPPVVVKPRFGSWGADIFRCETTHELKRVIAGVRSRSWFRKHGALVQELLPPRGYDLRLVVAAGRVVGTVERVAAPGEWRTNVALGGRRRPAVPSAQARVLGVRAVAAAGLELAGVDLHPVGDTHVVLELNGAVEFNSDYDLPGDDVYEAAADCLRLPRAVTEVRAVTA